MKLEEVNLKLKDLKKQSITSCNRWRLGRVWCSRSISARWPSFGTTASYVFNNIGSFMSSADDMKLRQRHVHRTSESSDMLLYLARVNEHAVSRIDGSKRWSVAHFLRTIQCLFEYGVHSLTT